MPQGTFYPMFHQIGRERVSQFYAQILLFRHNIHQYHKGISVQELFDFCIFVSFFFMSTHIVIERQDVFQYYSNPLFERYEFDEFSHLHPYEDTVCLLSQIRRDIHNLF